MGLGAKPRKGLSLPAPNSEHTFQQLLQGPLQGRILSNLRGTLRGRAIAHHLDPRDNFQNHCYYPLLSISALHFQSHDLNDILCRDMTSKKKKEKIINPLLVSRKEKKDFSRTRRHLQDHSIYKKNQTFATSGFRFFFSLMRRNFKDLSIFFSPNSFSLSYLYLYREKRGDKIKEKKKKKKMSAHAPPGTREPETKALLFRGGCLQPARGMRLAALTHWLPAKSFFFHSPFPSAPPSLPPPSPLPHSQLYSALA